MDGAAVDGAGVDGAGVDGAGVLVALGALARRADGAAADVRTRVGVLRAAGALPWRGAAADAFVGRLEEACAHALALAAALDDAEAAVRQHAARAAARAEVLAREAVLAGQVLAAVGGSAVAPWR